ESLSKCLERAAEFPLAELGQWLSFVQRGSRRAIVTWKSITNLRIQSFLNVFLRDLRLAVRTINQYADSVGAVTLAQSRHEPVGQADAEQLLIDHEKDRGNRVEGVDERQVGSRDVQHNVAVMARRKIHKRSNALWVDRRS